MALPQPPGFLALPSVGKGPGVLVLHAWWGLNETIRAFSTRLADSGFVAFAPDLYHGKVTDSIPEAESLVKALNADPSRVADELAMADRFLSRRSAAAEHGLAVIGFSLGANFALDVAASDPDRIRSVVLFYGTGAAELSASRAAYLGHFAENDLFEPLAGVDDLEQALRQAGRTVTFHRYPGTGHWFFEPDRQDAFHPAAAGLAWDRTLTFLRRPPDL